MSEFEQQIYSTESEVDDDSDEDPTFNVLQLTTSTFSKLSINKKSNHYSATKDDDDDADDIEGEEEVELVVPKLDEKDQKSYEAVQKLIGEGKLDKLKLDQCKIYLKKHGLRMAGNKDTLIQRIKEHISILDGGGERKYPASSFVLNCKGDACMGDIVMFEQNVYEMFNIASRSASGPPCGKRTVAGRIIRESYGAAKQQHTFTIEVLWSKGEKPFLPLHPLLIKGRNLYRITTMRQKWEDEGERRRILSDKHARGAVARSNRDARVMLKSKRAPNGKSKHENNKRGPTLQHPASQEQHEFKNQQKQNNFHVNDKTGPIMQHSLHVQLQQQRCHENKNLQNNHFHGNYKRGPNNAYQPKENRFHGNRYFPANGQRMNHHHHHHQTRHPFTNVDMEYSRMIPYGGRMHPSNYMGESSRIPYTQYGPPMHPLAATDTGSSMAPAESVTGRGGTYNTGRR
ncbi:hypothetical protein LIER_01400 [Lithospermum erythrorhizon]|uniref:SAP domain-containing protein n=1 Tax=Lithospermum erythrorhizon TaxID=34254 RepID=A0AAV3NKR7_LITER